MRPPPALVLADVALVIDGGVIVEGFDLEVAAGEIVTLMGPSGCGKSTLLAFIAGTLPRRIERSGSVWLEAVRIDALPPERRRVGILFQDDLLFPHLNVLGNLMFAVPPRIRGRQRRARAETALREVGLFDLAERQPSTLSGGQRARVALMRALLAEPRALLLDEPFGSLDQALRNGIRELVFETARRAAIPVVLATHDRGDACHAGGRIITPWQRADEGEKPAVFPGFGGNGPEYAIALPADGCQRPHDDQ